MSGAFKVAGINKISESWGETGQQFLVQLHCELVREGEAGGEAFQVTVISPGHLANEIGEGEVELGRGYLLAREYDERQVKERLQKLVDGAGADSWSRLIDFLEKYFDRV